MTLYPPNRLKQKLRAGEPAFGFWLSLNSLGVTERAAGAGWDWLLLDTEHSTHNDESVERHLLAALNGGTAEMVVRIPSIDPVLVKRLARRLRQTFPDLLIIARARDTHHAAALYAAGVTDAVPETLEASLQLSEAALVDLGVAMGPVIASIHEKRDQLRAQIRAEAQLDEKPRRLGQRLRDAQP